MKSYSRQSQTLQFSMRPHQREAFDIANKIVLGEWPKNQVIADVVPGGGKTILAVILASKLMEAGIIDSVIWVVPRVALREQVEIACVNAEWCNPNGYEFVAASVKKKSPLHPPDMAGCIASYDQLASGISRFLKHCQGRRVMVVFDEIQFLADSENAAWANAARALQQVAAFTLGMSGTLYRHDGVAVPFVEYSAPNAEGIALPKPDIRYSLSQAIGDGAIRAPQFDLLDGDVTWHEDGADKTASLSSYASDKPGRALVTFLHRPETWNALVDRAIRHWRAWQETQQSRIIVIADNITQAKRIERYISGTHKLSCCVATSDSDSAHEDLEKFRKSTTPQVLVTVAMASVGFDAPDCTHLVYLIRYRSTPWAMQAFGRVWRMQSGIDQDIQHAWIFVPNDPRMVEIINHIQSEVAEGVRIKDEHRATSPTEKTTENESFWFPINSKATAASFINTNGVVSGELARAIDELREKVPGANAVRPDLLADIIRHSTASNTNAQSAAPKPPATEGPTAVRDRLRREYADTCRRGSAAHGWPQGSVERILFKQRGGRSLDELTTDELRSELRKARNYLSEIYGDVG